MSSSFPFLYRKVLFVSVVLIATISITATLNAATLNLTWQDNSTNEDGFKIERSAGSNYVEIATVGANVNGYSDSGLSAGVTYCYRVRAFNASGVSDPSNEFCATTPVSPPTNYTLNLTKSGSGTGLITSSPTGINCGSDCSKSYASGTIVSLTATPASGASFAGWSGHSDCTDGTVTLDADKSCTATFNLSTAAYTLAVKIVSSLSPEGSGNGRVTSSPAGINCESDCSESYASGTFVSLTAVADSGSTFAGWSGNAECSDGKVTLDADKSCTATFKLDTATLTLVRSGNGTVSSEPGGINCGNDCLKSYAKGTKVKLSAKPSANVRFAGWAGGGCQGLGDCTVSLENHTSVSATFVKDTAGIGIFRPVTGEWFLDSNRDGIWEGCTIDLCLGPFGIAGDLPVAGDWSGSGRANIGVFRPSTGEWLLDFNGNGLWDDCKIDRCLKPLRPQTTLPLVGDWTGDGFDKVGELILEKGNKWYLDLNGDGVLQNCNRDACLKFPSNSGDLPVTGDWNGAGTAKVGVYRPASGEWFLDLNGNGLWDNCSADRCLQPFGGADDLPVAGNWTGTGIADVGLFRPATGEWFLDLNGNGQWDGCGIDGCYPFVGQHEGDLPVVGIW